MKKKKIFVLGYFGYKTNQLDGQTVKTKSIFEMFQNQLIHGKVDEVNYYDTQEARFNVSSFFKLFIALVHCNYLIIIPARNSLKILFPITYFFSFILGYKIIQVAVGGWQDVFFVQHRIVCFMCKNIRAILVQNTNVKLALNDTFGFKNVQVIPNFRINDFTPKFTESKTLRLVFMSRIRIEKGLDIIFKIADYINSKYLSGDVIIDFYGDIQSDDKDYFLENVDKYSFVNYFRALQPKEIYETLDNYDVLLLPTKYYTEGFPGAVLDAYISGIPVLVSNWKHAHEFVEDNKSGFICDVNDVSQFCDVIDQLFNNRKLLKKLKMGASQQSLKYSEVNAWNVMEQFI